MEPNDPEIVLLGLMFVSLGPLKIFPKTKPPISEAEQIKINNIKIIFNWKNFEKKINKKQKTKMYKINIKFTENK